VYKTTVCRNQRSSRGVARVYGEWRQRVIFRPSPHGNGRLGPPSHCDSPVPALHAAAGSADLVAVAAAVAAAIAAAVAAAVAVAVAAAAAVAVAAAAAAIAAAATVASPAATAAGLRGAALEARGLGGEDVGAAVGACPVAGPAFIGTTTAAAAAVAAAAASLPGADRQLHYRNRC